MAELTQKDVNELLDAVSDIENEKAAPRKHMDCIPNAIVHPLSQADVDKLLCRDDEGVKVPRWQAQWLEPYLRGGSKKVAKDTKKPVYIKVPMSVFSAMQEEMARLYELTGEKASELTKTEIDALLDAVNGGRDTEEDMNVKVQKEIVEIDEEMDRIERIIGNALENKDILVALPTSKKRIIKSLLTQKKQLTKKRHELQVKLLCLEDDHCQKCHGTGIITTIESDDTSVAMGGSDCDCGATPPTLS
jgi:hypothetical protein